MQNIKTDEFISRVAAFIDAKFLLPAGAGIVAAVSGGADSTVMLDVLVQLARRDQLGWEITVAHLDHSLRDSSAEDAEFVREQAKRYSLPFICERCDVRAEAERDGIGIEQAARQCRYDFLQRTARNVGAGKVALAHHADDNIETVIFRIFRGSSVHGLGGIPVSRPIGNSGVTLVRPMMELTREDIEEFCRLRNLTYRTDPTNTDTSFRRNFIRHELLPLIRENINSAASQAVARLSNNCAEIDEFLTASAEELLGCATKKQSREKIVMDHATLSSAPAVVRACATRLAMERVGCPMRNVTNEKIRQVQRLFADTSQAAINLPGGFSVRCNSQEITIESANSAAPTNDNFEIQLNVQGITPLPDGRTIDCRIISLDKNDFAEHCRKNPPGVELVDAEKISIAKGITATSRKAGDIFHPLGAGGKQKVGDFLTNLKIPRRLRDKTICIRDEKGIIFLAPHRIDEKVKVTNQTKTALKISVKTA